MAPRRASKPAVKVVVKPAPKAKVKAPGTAGAKRGPKPASAFAFGKSRA